MGPVVWRGDGETTGGKGMVEESGELLISWVRYGAVGRFVFLTCFCVIDGFRRYGAGVYRHCEELVDDGAEYYCW